MRRFVIGDIHGAHRAMVQCFERAGFNKQYDMLICLGDLCDGWPEVDRVFDELLTIRNLILLLGNHDQWLLDWFRKGYAPDIWLMQGGDVTLKSIDSGNKAAYHKLLLQARPYFILENKLFVHGGILTGVPLDQQSKEVFLWDRSLIRIAMMNRQAGKEVRLTSYDRVYVGHTPTINFNEFKPIITGGVCMLDTGAGWPGGLLTLMDIDSQLICQSDPVDDLYPDFKGRS